MTSRLTTFDHEQCDYLEHKQGLAEKQMKSPPPLEFNIY